MAVNLMPGIDLGEKVCAMLGLNPSEVTRLVIEIDAGALPIITVETLLAEPTAEGLLTELNRYRLTPMDEEGG